MFKLKEVYGTLCFEHAKIKLVILSKQANSINCLYSNELSCNYLDDNFRIINSNDFRDKLFNLVRGADEFLDMNIKRYILHVSCLPMQTITSTSANFLIFNQKLTKENYNSYINKYRNQNIGGDNLALEINPTGWTLDSKKYHNFPINMSGKELNFDFNALTCSEKLVNQFIDLLASLKLKVMKITNNSLCLASNLTKRKDVDNLVIDIKSRNAVINLYDWDGKIRNITTLPYGSNYIIDNIKSAFGIPTSESLAPIFNMIKQCQGLDDLTLINVYDENFLHLKEATIQNIKQRAKVVVRFIFDMIDKTIVTLRNKHVTNFTQVNLNVNDDLIDLFSFYCPEVIGNGLIVNLLKNNVIGLEDYNVNNILSAVQYVYNEQVQNNEFIYSVDAYISEEVNNEQVKHSIWIKLGLISTKWAAKIGE